MTKSTPLALLALVGLATVIMVSTGANYANADHCAYLTLTIGECVHETLRMSVSVVNATLYPAMTGDELVMWLELIPRPDPHNFMAVSHISTDDNHIFLSEHCVQYPANGKPLKITDRQLLKTCYFIPDYLDTDDLKQLHIGYELVETQYSPYQRINTAYDKTVNLHNVDFQRHPGQHEADPKPEPMTCEVPATTTPQPTIQHDTTQPQLLSAAYHTIFGDLVLSFDEQITLADNWQDNITVGGLSIGERAENHVDGASGLAWISVEYQVKRDLRDAESHTVTIEPGTFLDADGKPNDLITVRPTITG